jgi:hypothetical protein
LEIEAKRLQDEFVALKLAIEEAIAKGQRSRPGFREIPGRTLVLDKTSVLARVRARPGVVGWVDDL